MSISMLPEHRNLHVLGQEIFLLTDYGIDEHYILIPHRPGYELDLTMLDIDLAVHGLEMMEEDEMASVITDSGIKIWCAEILGGSEFDDDCIGEAACA